MKELHGIAASGGIATGPVRRFEQAQVVCSRCTVDDPAAELARLLAALQLAQQQLAAIAARARELSGEENAAIFQAQLLMLEDPALIGPARAAVVEQRLNAEAALSDAAEVQAGLLDALEDDYLRSRALDVRDVAQRLLRILAGRAGQAMTWSGAPAIVLADRLAPSEALMLDREHVLGFCTAEDGPTSHTAILARGLGLPAVVGAGPAVLEIRDGTPAVLDGSSGVLIVEPDSGTLARYHERCTHASALLSQARARAHEPAVTRDGRRVAVLANIGDLEGAQAALAAGAEGVGLLRTEFLFLGRSHLPDEEEQYQAYRAIAEACGDLPVVLRTLDVGGDKRLPALDLPLEPNPLLGLRAIRLCLARPELIRPQLRAALRAAAGGNLRVMLPMITTLAEVRAARALIEASQEELDVRGASHPARIEVGIMVETPAAALHADLLATEADFVSIGTNDLAQYTGAADRTNASVAELASGFQPAVLRLIRATVQAAHARGRRVSLCGELAAEALAIPILLGLGLDEFSVSVPAVAVTKELIRALSQAEAEDLARHAVDCESADAVRTLVRSRVPAAAAIV